MELKIINDILTDVGCRDDQKREARSLYESGQTDDLLRYLKKCRCGLMEEMHESQKKVDRMDYLIRKTEKEAIIQTDR